MDRLAIKLCGVDFKNPLIAASGTFGYGLEYAEVCDLNAMGGISVKGLSLEPHQGNSMPRIRETAAGMLNSIGLQNIGVRAFIKDKLPRLHEYNTRIIVNFWGKTEEEYCKVAQILDDVDVDMLEMNISCPNVKEGGQSFSATPDSAANVTSAVRKVVKNKPLIVKLSPNVSDITLYANAVERAGADALSAINTLIGMAINVKTRKPYLANGIGGLSGAAIKPIAVHIVHKIYKSVKIPIIGVGGIMTGEDAAEFFLAGASAVQVGTANFAEHEAIPRIASELNKYCADNSVNNVSELTGGLLI
ncbi:dihydroorotate dehydrogenase B (NAD(+)), catalytic subunit [Deferribacterales bacterium]|nr:dihydroorotate dehydrogenase B (NAD(+)), catalytic subunit [Deferribacterales bacterium]